MQMKEEQVFHFKKIMEIGFIAPLQSSQGFFSSCFSWFLWFNRMGELPGIRYVLLQKAKNKKRRKTNDR